MAIELTLRRGTESENKTFIGALGELSFDSQNNTVHIHDGENMGGYLIPSLIKYQDASEDNGKIWIRQYSNGLLEMGGFIDYGTEHRFIVNFPIPFKDKNYMVFLTSLSDGTITASVNYKESKENYIKVIKNNNASGCVWLAIGKWK